MSTNVVGRGPAGFDPQVAVERPTAFLESLLKCCDARFRFRIVLSRGHEHADVARAITLCSRRDRPCDRRAAEQGYQLAPSYVGHGLPLGTRCASLPHAEVAPEGTGRSLGQA